MNNPIDANEFRHYLRFNSLGRTDLYEIPEPIGFDGAQFIKEQEANRYARPIEYGAIDTIEFPKAIDKKLDAPRVYNIFGDTSEYMDWGFDFLEHINDTYGFESDVDYIVTLQGFEFCVGQLDFGADGITDGYSSFKFKLIQDNNVMDFQRQHDTKFNAFATEDVDGNTITPIPTFNYLRRNTPVIRNSVFKLPNNIQFQFIQGVAFLRFFNFSQVVENFGIDNTLSWFDPVEIGTDDAFNNIRVLKAKNDLINTSINTKLEGNMQFTGSDQMWLGLYYTIYNGSYAGGNFDIDLNGNPTNPNITRVYYKKVEGSARTEVLNENFTFSVPPIPRGHYLSLVWGARIGGAGNKFNFTKKDFDITATQVGIDTVIKASRYIDLIKQSVKSIKDVAVIAPDYDVNGKYYNQAVFNRRMISQNTDSFFSTFKDVMESVFELNQDYEISKNGIKILPYNRYYENAEIGTFPILPDRESMESYNPRFMVNNFKFGYNKFANERDIKGTEEGIHTDSEWLVPNKKVENKKEVKCKFVRDGFMIQDIVNQEIKDPITSTQNDDDVMVEDMIELAPNSVGTFGAFLLMRLEGSNLQILNRDSEGEANDVVFTWTTLGLAVGQSLQITSGVNVGTYNVVTLTPNLITLAPVGFTPTFVGDAFIQVRYTYSNVAFQTRTNQGFVSTDNRFLPNVRYSIKRNVLNTWGAYLKSMMLYAQSTFKNVYFKNNGAFTSQENGLLELTENANIEYPDLPEPILSAKLIDLTVVAQFDEVLAMLETYESVKGFIRAFDNNGRVFLGYAKKLEYIFATKELTLTLEQKYEPEVLELTYSDGVLTVNGVAYTVTPETWWLFKNDYVQFYDHKNTPITKYYKFNFISLNGILYGSATDLQNALLML